MTICDKCKAPEAKTCRFSYIDKSGMNQTKVIDLCPNCRKLIEERILEWEDANEKL